VAAQKLSKKQALRHTQARERVERLEDRILLSAQPLLVADSEPGAAGAVETVTLDPTQARSPQPSGFDALADIATFIHLGQGAQQSALLTADASDPSLLRLNDQLMILVLDLGSGNNAAVLSSVGDDQLRLSGASFNDIVFKRPGALLGIRGGAGVDSLRIDSVDIGAGSLEVETETMVLALGQSLSAGEGVPLRASASAQQVQSGSAALDLLARVSIEGSIRAGGQVTIDATVFTDVRLTLEDAQVNAAINAKTAAQAVIGAQASIQASGLSLRAHTYGHLEIAAGGAAAGSLTIEASQSTEAGVRDGAALVITGRSSGSSVDLLVEAVDQSRVATSLDISDSLIDSLDGFDPGLGQIKLQRQTLAYLGELEGQGAARLSLSGLDGAALGRVQVSAASLDAPEGGVQGQVVSGLVGVQRNAVDDQVQAHIARVDLKASDVQVYALNASSLAASAKVASNQVTGSTLARIVDSTLSAENDLHLLATDLASFEATSAGFAADVSALAGVSVGNASASNTLDRSLHADLEGSSVEASTLVVVAHGAATITAKSEAMAVKVGTLLAPDFRLAMGASQAWNQVLGDVQASIQRSSVVVVSLGGVALSAKNSSSVSAASVAGAAGTVGSAFSASLAFNAIGWRMGDIGAGALSSLLGADLNASELPLNTLAFVSASDIRSAAAVSVTAVNDTTLKAVMLSQASVSSGLGALSWGAAAVLTSNRVRSDTKAYIERASGSGSVVAGGAVTVSASDKAEILADVSLSAAGGMAVGGILVRNDVRSAVAADINAASVAAAGDLQVLAQESARIEASLSGTVTAGGSGFAASSLAANALVATNLVLSDAQAQVRDSTLTVDGSAEIAARNASTIASSNEAVTQGGGSAVGATLAFNTIGWQAQDVLSAGVDALLGSSLGLVRSAYESRRVFAELDRARAEQRQLDAEHKRLDAERQAQATHARVQRVAREQLKMASVTPAITVYVDDTVAASGAPR
jgi:cell division protein FtsL